MDRTSSATLGLVLFTLTTLFFHVLFMGMSIPAWPLFAWNGLVVDRFVG